MTSSPDNACEIDRSLLRHLETLALRVARGPNLYHDAQELAAEACARLWISRHTLRSPFALRAFARRILLNVAIDWAARSSRLPQIEAVNMDHLPGDDGEQRDVHAAIAALPAPDSELVERFAVEHHSISKIARDLGRGRSTVRILLRAAVEKLLAGLDDGEPSNTQAIQPGSIP